MSGRRQKASKASVQAALAELLGALGFRAMALQASAEHDDEALKLYARIIVQKAPEERRPEIRYRLERLGLL